MKLGNFELNNIYLGDSYELIKQIPDKSVDLIYTDIPYEYENGGKGGNVSYITSSEYHTSIDKFSYGINYSILDEFVRICKYIYMVFKRPNIANNKAFC